MKANSYTCYRKFLEDYLTENHLSYRQFAGQFQSYISFPFLSKLLRRNSKGQFVMELSLKPERLAALLKAMGLPTEDISHLVLCRLRSDQKPSRHKHSSTYNEVLNGLFSKNKQSLDRPPSDDMKFLEGLELLLSSRRHKVISELRHQLEIELARSTSSLHSQKLQKVLKDF